MCWISKIKPKKSRAIRDIPVYKILTYDPKKEKYTSPVMDYVYKFGKKGESILDLPRKTTLRNLCVPITVYNIDKGFYSYRKEFLKILYKSKSNRCNRDAYIIIGAQNSSTCWHIMTGKLYQNRSKHLVLCSAHIPRGSFYYLNECGEYVSDTLVIDKVLDADKELKELKKK